MTPDELFAALSGILNKLLDAKDLAEQELLRDNELSQLSENTKKQLNSLKSSFSDEWQRKYDKISQKRYRNRHIFGQFVNIKTYDERVGYLEEFINNLVNHLTGVPPKREEYISAGRPFDGRARLHFIFKQARREIVIVDNFFHSDMLVVLQSYVENVPNLSLKFLTRKNNNNNFSGFASDFKLFAQQYPNRQIEAKENNQCHGRFLIIDFNTVYHSGHSPHHLGQKADHINQIEDSKESQRFISDFNSWWNNGNIVS